MHITSAAFTGPHTAQIQREKHSTSQWEEWWSHRAKTCTNCQKLLKTFRQSPSQAKGPRGPLSCDSACDRIPVSHPQKPTLSMVQWVGRRLWSQENLVPSSTLQSCVSFGQLLNFSELHSVFSCGSWGHDAIGCKWGWLLMEVKGVAPNRTSVRGMNGGHGGSSHPRAWQETSHIPITLLLMTHEPPWFSKLQGASLEALGGGSWRFLIRLRLGKQRVGS